MNDATISTIDKARVCLAQGNIDQLRNLIHGLPPEVVCGNVFDRKYIPVTTDNIALILYNARKKSGIKRVTKEEEILLKRNTNLKCEKKSFPRINELEEIFESLENNLKLFDLKFDNRIHKLNTSNQRSILVSVEICNLFHLMGFDLYNWQNKYKKEILRIFPEFKKIMELDYIEICENDDRVLYDALNIILLNRDIIINELTSKNKVLIKAFNMNKVKIKNYIFEKSDYTSSPSGIIRHIPINTLIKGDLFVLRDFINWDVQDWSYFSFANFRQAPYRSGESMLFNFVPKNELNLSEIAYTTSVEVLDKKRFLKDRDENNIISKITFSEYEIGYVKSKLYVKK
jgi:hypothetical protein